MDISRENFLKERYQILLDSEEFAFLKFPMIHMPNIIPEDYKKGFINRFFIKKINDVPITEIDSDQFDYFSSKNFYKTLSIEWKISGPRNNVIKKNIVEIEGVEDHNQKQLQIAEVNFHGIKLKLPNLLEFWRGF